MVFPTTHAFATKKRLKVRLEDLREEILISGPVDTMLRRLVDGAASNGGISLRYGVTVERLMSILGHVRAGVGIAVVPEGVLPPKPWKEFDAMALSEPALALSFGLITLPGRYLTPAASSMMALVRERARALASRTRRKPWRRLHPLSRPAESRPRLLPPPPKAGPTAHLPDTSPAFAFARPCRIKLCRRATGTRLSTSGSARSPGGDKADNACVDSSRLSPRQRGSVWCSGRVPFTH